MMVDIKGFDSVHDLYYPRRVMKYLLVYCKIGEVNMTVDEMDFSLKGGQVITITSGQLHRFNNVSAAEGYILEFTLDYFGKDDNDIDLIFHNGLFCHFGMNEVITVNNSVVADELHLIQSELIEQPYQYLVSIHARIKLILVSINRTKVEQGAEIWKPNALFLKFLEAVRDNFAHNYSVSAFARMLGTTEVKLNELSKVHAGKTAQNVIYGLKKQSNIDGHIALFAW